MYVSASQLRTLPIISLQTGDVAALVRAPILELSSLGVMALHCEDPHSKTRLVLMAGDIRQFASDCIIIDDEDELTDPNDIVRFKSMLETSYDPIGKAVVSDAGRKLGSVEDYSLNLETGRVQQIHVRGSLLKAWLGTSLIIDRTQIIDITPRQITVRDATVKAPVTQPAPAPKLPLDPA